MRLLTSKGLASFVDNTFVWLGGMGPRHCTNHEMNVLKFSYEVAELAVGVDHIACFFKKRVIICNVSEGL